MIRVFQWRTLPRVRLAEHLARFGSRLNPIDDCLSVSSSKQSPIRISLSSTVNLDFRGFRGPCGLFVFAEEQRHVASWQHFLYFFSLPHQHDWLRPGGQGCARPSSRSALESIVKDWMSGQLVELTGDVLAQRCRCVCHFRRQFLASVDQSDHVAEITASVKGLPCRTPPAWSPRGRAAGWPEPICLTAGRPRRHEEMPRPATDSRNRGSTPRIDASVGITSSSRPESGCLKRQIIPLCWSFSSPSSLTRFSKRWYSLVVVISAITSMSSVGRNSALLTFPWVT